MLRFRLVICLCLICLVAVFGTVGGAAQSVTTAEDILARAQQLAADARVRYQGSGSFSIDQALWREAVAMGERGLELAPNDPDILRFLAETHTSIDWHIRAWDYWLRYLDAGGSLDRAAQTQLAEVGAELGYARYQAGNLAGALGYYERLYDLNAGDTDALRWIGRIYFERGEPATALPYWREAAARGAEGADYYLRRTEQQLAVGINASDTFHQGLEAYNAGEPEAALGSFERATRYNDGFAEAFAWTGRVNLELGRPAAAVSAWEQVVALTPNDDGARYFLQVATAQQTWGVRAARAFYDGLTLYNEGRVAEASARFAAAAEQNPDYTEAFVWAARSFQESGDAERAAAYWRRVLELNPDDDRARYFLQVGRGPQGQGTQGDEGSINLALERGRAAYQRADFDAAERAFGAATEQQPESAEAWGWLGRVYFEQGAYERAARAYSRAAGLEPANDAYTFFAGEAARLAEAERP